MGQLHFLALKWRLVEYSCSWQVADNIQIFALKVTGDNQSLNLNYKEMRIKSKKY